MNINEICNKIRDEPEYNFLRDNPHLGSNIILLGLGGSYAYGTNTESSDLDIRGIATRTRRDILTGENFEQVVDVPTDTTIYSFDKMVKLLCSANPNTLEIVGLKPEHYLYVSKAGELLLKNKNLFLSKRVVNTFGGYAAGQLHRLSNKAVRKVPQKEQEEHIFKTIEYAKSSIISHYNSLPDGAINLYVDTAVTEGLDAEIFMDLDIKKYPIRSFSGIQNEFTQIVRSYDKLGTRNKKAAEHGKIAKHSMHLIRLYFMLFDILENGEVITYREKEHALLMDIRDGKYLDGNDQPIPAFFEMVAEFENKMNYLAGRTELPDECDMEKVKDLVEEINGAIVEGLM